MAVKNGVEEISENGFENKIKKGLVAIDFFANWCMPCVMMSPVIEEMAEKFKGKIRFYKLDVDENSKIAEKFKVMSIPCLIVFKNGKEVERIIGARQGQQLEEILRKFVK